MVARNHLGRVVQIPSPGVIAESSPVVQHVVNSGRCQRLKIREPLDKPVIIGNHRGHLGLLQHDLRNPAVIRIIGMLPRQVPAALLPIPSDHSGGKRRCVWRYTGLCQRPAGFRPLDSGSTLRLAGFWHHHEHTTDAPAGVDGPLA